MVATIPAGRWSDRRTVGVVTGAVAAPILVLLARVVRSHWLSIADWAAIELRTRDVGTAHIPLVGPASRYGWNHPGPMLFYVLALPYRLFGREAHGLLAGALAVNAAALALIAVVLWRRGGVAGLTIGFAAVLLLTRALGAGFLVDPWNPYVIVLPLVAVICLSWAAADGDLWALPAAIGVGSFAVQSHVGVALAVLAPIAVAVLVLLLDARRCGFRRLRPAALSSVVVAVICWSAPLVQQFQPGGGNLGDLMRFWARAHPRTTGWSKGARLIGQQLAIPAPWFTGHQHVNVYSGGVEPPWKVPITLFLLVGAMAVAALRRDRQSFTLDSLALAFAFAALFSAAHIVDTPYNYIVRWMWTVGAIAWLAIIWTAWRAFPRSIVRDRAASWSAAAVGTVLAGMLAVGAVHARVPVQADQGTLAGIAPIARRALRALPGPVLLEGAHGDFHSTESAVGVLLVGIDAGIDARLAGSAANAVGTAHTTSKVRARSVVVVAVDNLIGPYRNDPAFRTIARYDPLTVEERTYRSAVLAELQRAASGGFAGLKRWSATHQRDRSRVHELDGRGPRIELFLQTAR